MLDVLLYYCHTTTQCIRLYTSKIKYSVIFILQLK